MNDLQDDHSDAYNSESIGSVHSSSKQLPNQQWMASSIDLRRDWSLLYLSENI